LRKEQFYKKLDLFVVVIILLLSFQINAQSEEDLFSMIVEKDKSELPLLPERMVFTQRFLWGNKGLLRQSKIVPLSRQMREQELKVRRIMLKTHQVIGYTTLLAMIAQGFIGGKLYNGDNSLYDTHKTMGKIVNIGYFSGAGLSLFAPPPLINKKVRGLNSIKAHKILATIHFSAMLSTNYFSDRDRGAHKASAYTLFGSYTAAVLVFKF
jgi:hypothetical protein